MNHRQKLIEQAGLDFDIGTIELNQLIDLTVKQCIKAIKSTPLTHCHTTFDHSQAQGTLEQCVNHVRNQFDI